MSLLDEIKTHVHSRKYLTDMGREHPSEILRPASAARIRDAEFKLGFALPLLLRGLYARVANGGFGPGYGLIGIEGGAPHDAAGGEWDIIDLYHAFRQRPTRHEPWGERMLPVCHWGCSYYSYIDCALPQAPVLTLDENSHGHGPFGYAFALHARSFEEWMRRWIAGEDLWTIIENDLAGEPIFGFEENA